MDLGTFALLFPIVLVSLTLHELAHAWVAWRLGDPTAKSQGRLTLNPIVHLDPLGTLMFVLTALIANLPFGWARPVPVDPRYFRRAKEGMAIVAAAGPLMNFLLALVCWGVVRHVELSGQWTEVLEKAYIVNLVLGIFNLIPVPPLDGSRILGALMDDATYVRWIRLDQYGMLVVFGAFFLFQEQFTRVLTDLIIHVTRVMDVLVLAT
ncbi:MAG TPA: site-2 protease family protein [Gaiellaceae bacterium]|jgi:Zn-dependent protease|nr:site-2 protease family protein [Gaiellaceae bacterium]